MFKKPIQVTHKHEIELPDTEKLVEPIVNQLTPVVRELKDTLKTVGIALAIGIPAVILFGFACNVTADVVTDRLTDSQ